MSITEVVQISPSSSDLDELWNSVIDLSERSIAEVYLPLLPPVFSKGDVIKCLQKFKKLNVDISTKLILITMLTDYVVSAITGNTPVDIFQQDFSDKSKIYIMEMISKEWRRLFLIISNSFHKPTAAAMQVILTFLRRMRDLLFVRHPKLSQMLSSSTIDECFWNYNLQSLSGKDSMYFLHSNSSAPIENKNSSGDSTTNSDLLNKSICYNRLLSNCPNSSDGLVTTDGKNKKIPELDFDYIKDGVKKMTNWASLSSLETGSGVHNSKSFESPLNLSRQSSYSYQCLNSPETSIGGSICSRSNSR